MARKRPHKGNKRRGSTKGPRKQRRTINGILRVLRPGIAVVETAEGSFDVAPAGMREAMSGDEVSVFIVGGKPGQPRRAIVDAVLNRATSTLLGRFEAAGPLGAVVPLDNRLSHDFFVLPEDTSPERLGVAPGDVVAARILEYPNRYSGAVVTLDRRVGSADDLDMNIESVIASHGLACEFSPATMEEARRIEPAVGEALASDPRRADLRDAMCVTIDPADARDFDDAVGAREREDGGFDLDVHIADVTHYLPWGSSMDVEARARTCSVYLVDRVIPMLPERLCNDVCSLRPREDRLAMTVRMHLGPDGRVLGSRARCSAIRSNARLCYDEVDALLDGKKTASELPVLPEEQEEVAHMLRVLDHIRELRGEVRRRRGAIDFETRESRVELDDAGRPVGVRVRERTRATGLVEEAMLLANECVARILADAEVPCAYRVHEQPAAEDLRHAIAPLNELGLLEAGDAAALLTADPKAIARVLDRARGTSGEYLASAVLLRAQSRAVYLPQNEGHYALGASAYCHFTSPIRRYPDDLVHRALKAKLYGKLDSPEQRAVARQLPQLCADCSRMERTADAAARESQKVKMAELYEGRVGQYEQGVVSGVERFGVFVSLDETDADGLVPVRKLGAEWYQYDEDRMRLCGESTGETWTLGRRVVVRVADVDIPRGRIDFTLPRTSKAQRPYESLDELPARLLAAQASAEEDRAATDDAN